MQGVCNVHSFIVYNIQSQVEGLARQGTEERGYGAIVSRPCR